MALILNSFYISAWDASPDGSEIVYQQSYTSSGPPSFHTRQFLVAHADGSQPMPIFSQVNNIDLLAFTRLDFSPDGKKVALLGDQNAATCYTSNLDGSTFRKYGKSGGSSGNELVFDAPVNAYPLAWLADSSGFDIVTALIEGQTLGDDFISQFLLTTPPGPGGLVPGTTQISEAFDVTILA